MKNVPTQVGDIAKLGQTQMRTRMVSLKTATQDALQVATQKGIKGLDKVGQTATAMKGSLNLPPRAHLALAGMGGIPNQAPSKIVQGTENLKDVLQKFDVNLSGKGKQADGIIKETSGANNLKINSNAKNHLANSEGFVRKGGQGVKGGHNIASFYGELNAQGFNIDDCIINKKAHPTIKGIYEIEYKVPAMDNKGNIIPNKYKNIRQPKTVYDPKYFSDSTIYDLGIEAMRNGEISGREIVGVASNGLEFTGFINEAGEVNNFFPSMRK
ncbi:CdiA family toxin C-terminal domain-containing protein [Listeria goaensis]|uniref:CdiA family toxin C-terminal domain-containing protein n=2 Tax=Listeria TaxID=1637 RepID=UPI001FC93210|nr:CdiA family toxin C-terminal domain-containing protein [Listeria goaensis]